MSENSDRQSDLADILLLFRTKQNVASSPKGMIDPTTQAYSHLRHAYGFFNRRLFDNVLPQCLITMQRKKWSLGYFCGRRFKSFDGTDIADEIALNPVHFAERGDKDVLSTLVHEMVHLWQEHFGHPSRTGYHNSEWAAKMRLIGLVPSHNGEIDGRQTGQKMTHYILPGGQFDCAADELIEKGFVIGYVERASTGGADPVAIQKRESKTRYSCPICGLNAWAKPEVHLICGACGQRME